MTPEIMDNKFRVMNRNDYVTEEVLKLEDLKRSMIKLRHIPSRISYSIQFDLPFSPGEEMK